VRGGAAAIREAFSGEPARDVDVTVAEPEGDVQAVGEVLQLHYITSRMGWPHRMEHDFEPGCGPDLVEDESGAAFFGGGDYVVGEQGIEDGRRRWPDAIGSPRGKPWILGELVYLQIEPLGDSDPVLEWEPGEGPYLLVDQDGRLHMSADDDNDDNDDNNDDEGED
jgi:hypothetical protein